MHNARVREWLNEGECRLSQSHFDSPAGRLQTNIVHTADCRCHSNSDCVVGPVKWGRGTYVSIYVYVCKHSGIMNIF